MRRMSFRLLVGHVGVGLLGALVMYGVVRVLAPQIFDAELRRVARAELGVGPGPGVAEDFARSVDQALIVGLLAGTLVAVGGGVFVAIRVNRTVDRVREGARRFAAGDYSADVPVPVETELAEMAHDINTLGAALAATEARRLRLLGEVAHEMRTPLTIIDGYVEGMIDGLLPPDPEHLTQMAHETRRLRRLSDDLSSLSRAEEGHLAFNPHPLDLRDAVRGAAERLRSQAVDAGVTLVVDLAHDPIPVVADADRISQVVTNVVGNAIAATPAGGVITVQGRLGDAEGVIRVRDTGKGIAADDLPHVFERFFRVDGAEGTGSGIGLTIARTIAGMHDGTLTATSDGLGHGATFTLRIPLAPEA